MFQNGLVLEGGGMRGLFTAGVLDFFIDKDIEFAEVIGVSAGACHSCSYVSKQRGRARSSTIDHIDDKNFCSLYSLFKTGDLFCAKFSYDDIPNRLNPFDYDTFNKSNTKLFSTVTNVETGQAEYIRLCEMHEDIQAVRASASLPLVSQIVEYKGKKYLDGGIADSIPLKKIEADGYLKNVVVLTQPKGFIKQKNKAMGLIELKYKEYPKLIEQMANRHNVYNDTLDYIYKQEEVGLCFVIQPKENLDIGRVEKSKEKLDLAYSLGYECAKENYDTMTEFLKSQV